MQLPVAFTEHLDEALAFIYSLEKYVEPTVVLGKNRFGFFSSSVCTTRVQASPSLSLSLSLVTHSHTSLSLSLSLSFQFRRF